MRYFLFNYFSADGNGECLVMYNDLVDLEEVDKDAASWAFRNTCDFEVGHTFRELTMEEYYTYKQED